MRGTVSNSVNPPRLRRRVVPGEESSLQPQMPTAAPVRERGAGGRNPEGGGWRTLPGSPLAAPEEPFTLDLHTRDLPRPWEARGGSREELVQLLP